LSKYFQSIDRTHSDLSRRRFLRGAATAAVASVGVAGARQGTKTVRTLAYVGTYSSPQGPEGSKGYGEGIYLFEMDGETGALARRDVFRNASNPSWLALNGSGTRLYAANETATFENANSGSVSAYAVDKASGQLSLLNTVSSRGAGPAHLSVHPSDKYVLVANYAGGSITVLPIQETGELGPPTDAKHDRGEPGVPRAASAPAGSFAISGHDRPHAHMIQSDPSGRFVFVPDLGLDRILIWKFDVGKGTLSPADPAFFALPAGDGPRHFTFHPNGRLFYSLQEEGSTIAVCDFDGEAGQLTMKQTISTLPKGFAGTNFTSEIRISPDARFLYVANRLHDSIAFFSMAADGTLTFAGETWTRGDYPRSFTIDPTGNFLYSCNQRSDAIATFRVDRRTGELTFTEQYTPVGTPAIIVFLT
jgi:6-phosphogluconolactonase